MFHSKKEKVDFKRVTQKFLDSKRESRQRAHALRTLLDNFETHEAKVFFQRHYSEIYYICHDYFSIVEVNLRLKANRAVRDDLDCVLYIFEKLLLLLPELVHERWQFASIGRTMLKLLHHGNAFKLRSEGIRLLILWLQALQENMDISCEVMFACVVPGFPNPLDTIDTSTINVPAHVLEDICNFVRGNESGSSSGSMTLLPQEVKDGGNGWCSPDELQILVPLINQSQTEKVPGLEDLTKVYLDRVLDYMITQISKIEWLDKSMRKKGFECLFNLFKKYYLHHVFPMWTPRTNLYATDPEDQVEELDVSAIKNMPPLNSLTKYADSVVKWFVAFLSKIKRVVKMQTGEQSPKSNTQSMDSLGAVTSDSQLSSASESSRTAIYEDLLLGGDIILDVIYSTRENVHIVHEVFRQAFILPMSKSAVIKEVLVVYHNWLKLDNKPKFMLEPDLEATSSSGEDVRAGMQGNIRLLIYHSSFMFLTPNASGSLKQKVNFCERVILMYRNIVLETAMVAKTWEQLLVVLLTVAKNVLEDKIVEPKMSSFPGRLAPVLLQTLFVTWIRANLNVTVSVELWDRFLDVVSSLTHWSEVVSEWKSTMDILTNVIAGRVYCLNLKDLPLDRLSEQKHKKRRHQLDSKTRLIGMDRSRVTPSPTVQESKPEVTSSSAAPVTVVPSTVAKTAEPGKSEGNTAVVTENLDKPIPEIAEEPESCDNGVAPVDPETISQDTLEQESEQGYESDVTDSGSELSFGKTTTKASETDMSLGSLLGKFNSWPGAGASASREGSLDGEKGAISSIPKDEDSLNETSASKSGIDSSANQEATDEVDGRGRKDNKKTLKSFWKDSDGGDEISSDSESVPASFSNPIHEESFDSVVPTSTEMMGDQNVPLEIVEPSVHSLDMDTEVSVVCGGTKEGWTPVAAVVLWTRMLGVLGNVNDIESASIHAQVLNALYELWRLLAKIRLNQGISLDNKSTPPVPNLLPPLHYFASWLFQAAYLPQKYKQGRLIAYQLICEMTVRRQDNPLSEDYLRHFYRCLHDGLTNFDQDVINAIMGKCDNFFGMVLPSSSLLILDFIHAANTIIESANTGHPRTEAVTILGSLLCYPNAFPNMKIFQIGSTTMNDEPAVIPCREIKDKISDALYKAAVTDPDCHARCTALCAIGIFIVEELIHNKGHSRLHHYTSLLLTSIMFKNCSVSSVAIGLVQNLSEYHEQLFHFDHDLPLKIVEVLCEVIRRCVDEGSGLDTSHVVKILNPLMFCLLDWVMVIPLGSLLRVQDDSQTTLAQVFQALMFVVSNESTKTVREFSISRMISREDLQIHLGQIHQDIADSAPSSPADFRDNGPSGSGTPSQTMERIRKTAKAVILHIVNHLNHFPLAAGAARLTSIVNENQDNPYCTEEQELTAAVFSSPNVQFFVVNDSSLISMVELPVQDGSAEDENLLCGNTKVRLVVRDICGKHCLDISTLFGPRVNSEESFPGVLKSIFSQEELSEILDCDKRTLIRRRSTACLQPDKLDQLLKDIGSSSPECLFYPHSALNEPAPPPDPLDAEMEQSLIEAIQLQREREEQFCDNALDDPRLKGKPITPKEYQEPNNPFHLSHFLFNQLGMFGWEKRSKIDFLKKSDMLIRELKNLDNRKSRETHKIAVFFVAPGQEDKTSIMSNTSGSKEYEDFVAGLAWEVELSTHTGFMGGLDKNQSTGTTAVYYANSTVEVMFHVATRMPVSSEESGFIKKVRHLGNDEIWIVWSEHSRDFRHGIVNAEFGDVVIIIYPLQNHLFRIQILKKGDIPYFGPLFDGAIVDRRVLPALVRMTAVNASRAKRYLIPGMQTYYEERASCISDIVKHHKETTVFEDFAERVFCPVPRKSEENNPVFSISSHLRQQVSGGDGSGTKREGYSTLPSSKNMTKGLAGDKDAIPATMSLPEGLHKVMQSDSTIPAPKLGKKMSFRKKLTPSTKEENTE